MSEPKVNGNGRKCPEWCETDHGVPGDELDTCRSGEPFIPARKDVMCSYRAYAALSAWGDSKPRVVTLGSPGIVLTETSAQARDLAKFVGSLAETTPAKIRQLATQIDRAAEAAFGAEREPEAGT
jgi:hypothetical protein